MIKRYAFFALIFLAVTLGQVTNVRAQSIVSTLGYNGYDLTGYSRTYGNPYSEWEECVLPDVDEEGYPYCALMNIYVPWVSLYGYLNGALDGSDIEDDYAIVYHGASHPPTGYWSSSGEHYVGDWAYEQWCYDSLECDYPYYVGYDILVGPIYSYSDTVPIQHLTSATYNVSSFYAPGSLAVTADYGIPIIDFQYTFNDGPVIEQDNWANGQSSYVGINDTQYFGTYHLLKAKSHADGDWAWVTLSLPILLAVIQAPPPVVTVSPGTLFLSTGDTNKTITTTISPATSITPGFSWGLQSNPNSSCQASLSFTSNSGVGSVDNTVTASPAGCGGIFGVRAIAIGQTSNNQTVVTVPPQIMIQTVVGEAGSQTSPGDASMASVLLVAKNRFGDSAFPGGTAGTWQAVLVPGQFYGASDTTANGVEPELDTAAAVFAGTSSVTIPSDCKGLWSPTNAQYATLQTWLSNASAANSITDTNWSNVGAPGLWGGQPKQAVIKTSIANSVITGHTSAPAFVLFRLAPSGTSPAVITIP